MTDNGNELPDESLKRFEREMEKLDKQWKWICGGFVLLGGYSIACGVFSWNPMSDAELTTFGRFWSALVGVGTAAFGAYGLTRQRRRDRKSA